MHYALLVSFFPHVIAGPIVNYDELLPQFKKPSLFSLKLGLMTDGVAFFLLGLAKKVVLADQFGVYANEGFAAVAQGHGLSLFAAWAAALAYTLQLYFDFSGYSDMAFGLARLFGLQFPINFNSPYKARKSSSSGGAGTSRCRASCAIISIFRSAATATARRGATPIF